MEDIKTVALRFARETDESNVTDCPGHGIVVTLFADELAEVVAKTMAELQKDATPVGEVLMGALSCADDAMYDRFVNLPDGTKLYTHPQPKAATVPQEVTDTNVGDIKHPYELMRLLQLAEEEFSDRAASIQEGGNPGQMQDVPEWAHIVTRLLSAPSLPAQSEGEQK